MVNENSLINLKNAKPFGPTNPPPGIGRPAGTPNRKTVALKYLNLVTQCKDINGQDAQMPILDQIYATMANAARKGDINAAYFIIDSGFGKLSNKTEIETVSRPHFDPSKLTNEQLDQLIALHRIGAIDPNSHIQEAETITDTPVEVITPPNGWD